VPPLLRGALSAISQRFADAASFLPERGRAERRGASRPFAKWSTMWTGRALRVLCLGLALAFAITWVRPADARRNSTPGTGLKAVFLSKPPPDFSFDVGDGTERLRALEGKPVVLNFWATWCAPCTAELDAFGKLGPTFGDAVTLVTLSAEPAGTARRYLEAHQLELPLVEDPTRKIFDAYSIGAIPVTIVLARNGSVARVVIGELTWDELHGFVSEQLAVSQPSSQPGVPTTSSPTAASR
jgi:peroxiredoxin